MQRHSWSLSSSLHSPFNLAVVSNNAEVDAANMVHPTTEIYVVDLVCEANFLMKHFGL